MDTTNRRVHPLYKQLWHAHYPNIAFIGLPHSILPFPFFELQANAIANQWTKSSSTTQQDTPDKCTQVFDIPDRIQREKEATIDAESGGPEPNGRVPQDTHYLGSYQWDYCRIMSKFANTYSDSFEKYIQTNKVRSVCFWKEIVEVVYKYCCFVQSIVCGSGFRLKFLVLYPNFYPPL